MKPGVLAAIVVGILVIVGGVLFAASGEDTATPVANTESSQQTGSNETSAPAPGADSDDQLLKMDEVAAHSTENDCWTIISGSVYDITAYVPRHPGGDEILRACGADGTSLFQERTTADGEQVGSGTSHSGNAENQLADFKIGTLDTQAE